MPDPRREISLDTETTGIGPDKGHRIFEIGVVELRDAVPTGREQRWLVDPGVELDAEAARQTGYVRADLVGYPPIADILPEFLSFVGDDTLVIHNATFDIGFLNAELQYAGYGKLQNSVVDTLEISKNKFPGRSHKLDDLCKRLDVDNSSRKYHGALLDAQILARVYLELLGRNYSMDLDVAEDTEEFTGNQAASEVDAGSNEAGGVQSASKAAQVRPWPVRQLGGATAAERDAHSNFVDGKIDNPIWRHSSF